KLARRAALLAALALTAAAITSPANADVYVRVGPPPDRYEVMPPPPPGPHRWVWTRGHWRWDGHRYAWAHGRYIERAHGDWRPGHWEHRHDGWFWVEGAWF